MQYVQKNLDIKGLETDINEYEMFYWSPLLIVAS